MTNTDGRHIVSSYFFKISLDETEFEPITLDKPSRAEFFELSSIAPLPQPTATGRRTYPLFSSIQKPIFYEKKRQHSYVRR